MGDRDPRARVAAPARKPFGLRVTTRYKWNDAEKVVERMRWYETVEARARARIALAEPEWYEAAVVLEDVDG